MYLFHCILNIIHPYTHSYTFPFSPPTSEHTLQPRLLLYVGCILQPYWSQCWALDFLSNTRQHIGVDCNTEIVTSSWYPWIKKKSPPQYKLIMKQSIEFPPTHGQRTHSIPLYSRHILLVASGVDPWARLALLDQSRCRDGPTLPSLRPTPNPKPAPTQTLGLREGRVGLSPETWIDPPSLGVLPYVSYIGMFHSIGCHFQGPLSKQVFKRIFYSSPPTTT